ncbi:MAG: hypothetical protein KDA60_10390, partial [Planctomycetales bacterium]|nr:hypothetical protein [Planctomycetales bacterium]
MRYLGIDLGSSFLKGAVLNVDSCDLEHVERIPFPDPVPLLPASFREFDPMQIVASVQRLLERLLRHAPDAAGILCCSQLHGMVLTDDQGRPRSNYIGWQDQRALLPQPNYGGRYFDHLQELLDNDERMSLGNEPRPGVPLAFLYWLRENGQLPDSTVTPASLPYFVIANLMQTPAVVDVTHAHGYGLLEVESLNWHLPVIDRLQLSTIRWPTIVPQGAVVGHWPMGSRSIPIFAPVGDFHCSQVGALLDEGELSINVSTGSAVIQVATSYTWGDFQTRPWFDGRYLKAITHIPAGRALNALVRLFSELATTQGVVLKDPWEYILEQSERVEENALCVDPAFYFSALGEEGAITHVREENMTVGHLFHA